MWYVIQTISGKEQEICTWINCRVDNTFYRRCFTPLYEDVWRKEGIGHISVKKMFPGYVFIDTDTPEMIQDALKEKLGLSIMLSAEDTHSGREFQAIRQEEEAFLDTVLTDGMMKVSYVKMSGRGKFHTVIGPLQNYTDHIVRVDIPHRRAIVELPMLGGIKSIKFGLWLDTDPKITWIEEAKREQSGMTHEGPTQPANPWDWKAWKKINANKADKDTKEDMFGIRVGDRVINNTGIYGDTPLEVVEIRPGKNSVVVNVTIFGETIRVEMDMEDVQIDA